MIIDGDKITGPRSITETLWVTNCAFKDAGLVIDGDFYVEGPCTFDKASIYASGDILFRSEAIVDGDVTCEGLFCIQEPCQFGNILAKKVLTRGELKCKTLQADAIRLYGSICCDVLAAKNIWIDGDIVANTVIADEVHVERGSILAKELRVNHAKADIIGNYSHERLDENKYTFKWARPMVEGAEPKTTDTDDVILNGFLVMKACIVHIPELTYILDKFSTLRSCSDFSSEKQAIFSDIKKHYTRLNPAAQQFIECVDTHGFPDFLWRF